MIQFITNNTEFENDKFIKISRLDSPKNFGDFNLNIIDLNYQGIWSSRNRENSSISSLNSDIHFLKDFILLNKLLTQTHSDVMILIPGDLDICYGNDTRGYAKAAKLKNNINLLDRWMRDLDDDFDYLSNIIYAETESKINNLTLESKYVFSQIPYVDNLTKNLASTNATTIKFRNILRSTLIINNNEELIVLLRYLGYIENSISIVPEWMGGVSMFDDTEQNQIIESNRTIIDEAKLNIYSAECILESNNYLKSILYTQSDSLVETVFEIIEEIFDCDLSNFEDEKLEDFNFEVDGRYYIGEIKGVTSNVKNENVSQLDVHYQRFIDENPEIELENIYALLIMNHQRKKPLSDRESVHDNQIQLAKRNGSLIVETYELLKMLDKLRRKELTNEQCIEMLSSKTEGILRIKK